MSSERSAAFVGGMSPLADGSDLLGMAWGVGTWGTTSPDVCDQIDATNVPSIITPRVVRTSIAPAASTPFMTSRQALTGRL